MSAAAPGPAQRRCWFLLAAALLGLAQLPVGLLAPPGRPGLRAYPPLVARGGLEVYPVHQGFVPNGVYPATTPDSAYPGIEKFGSWLGGNESTGRLETPWFRPGGAFELLVAGYPSTHGNSVTLELRRPGDEPPGGATTRRTLEFDDAHERWVWQHVRLRAEESAGGLTEARLVAVDAGTGPAGWLGVSAPFHEGRHTLTWSLEVLGRFALAVGAAVTALAGAGLAWRWQVRARCGGEEPGGWASLAFVPLPGAAWLVGTALLAWRLAPGVNPAWVSAVGLAPLFGFCAGVFARAPGRTLASATEWRVLGVAGLVLAVALTKASVSVGPAGELYGGTVSRTLEVGGRSDSRIAFHTVQLVAHGTPPFSPVGRGYFAPWGFSSRGPLLALASAPLVLATGAQVPVTMPDQPWLPFDPEGFTAYRLAMMALGAAALLPLFAAAGALLGGDQRGLRAVALAALTPFVVHEVWFTWGKLPTAGCLAAAVYGLANRRFGAAGACVAVGYLCHPLALLYLPFLGLGALWRAATAGEGDPLRRGGRALAAGVRFVVPVGLALGFWRWVGRGEDGQGQGFFLNYLFGPSTWQAFDFGVWARHRGESLLNTLFPGWLFFVNSGEPEMNALDHPSPPVVRWFFLYWNTLPFGLGIVGFWTLCRRWGQVARARPGVFALAGVAPFALFAIYWGAAATGLMREGLHPWVLSLLVLAAAAATGTGKGVGPWLLAGRGVEVLALAWLPTLRTSPLLPRPAYAWVDGTMLALNLAALAALTVACFRVYRTAEPAPEASAPR